MKLVNAPIISNKEAMPNVHLITTQAPEIAALARPGQYVMVRCGDGHDMPLRRPLSIHRISKDNIALLFAVVGRGTEWLSQREAGEHIDLFGPLGKGFEICPSSQNLLLVAGGIGIAPLVALAEQAVTIGCSVILLIGDKTAAKIYPNHLLPSEIRPVIATEDGSLGLRGMVTDIISKFRQNADQIFACGPLPMYKAMAGMSRELGEKPVQVLLESVLGCGVGACLSCTIETKRGQKLVCKDGPVFELSDILWDKVVAPPVGRRY